MDYLRIAHISDTHLGYTSKSLGSNRYPDFIRAWNSAIDQIEAYQPDLVIHSGDVFHHPRPTWQAVAEALQGLTRLVSIAPTVVCTGNHDISRMRSEHNALTLLSQAIPEIHLAAGYRPEVYDFPTLDTRVTVVPHGALTANQTDAQNDQQARWQILVSHGDVDRSRLDSYEHGSVALPGPLLDQPWNYIALGHIHQTHFVTPRCYYAGSIERSGWSDFDATPGWLQVEVSDLAVRVTHEGCWHREFIQMKPMPYIDLEQAASDVFHAIEYQKNPEAIYRVVLTGSTSGQAGRVESVLRKSAGKLCFGLQCSHTEEIKRVDQTPMQLQRIASIPEMFADFLVERKLETAFEERFKEKALTLLAQAAEAENTREPES